MEDLKIQTEMTLSVIGCGTMATAILSGVINACTKEKAAGRKPRFNKFIATVQSQGSAARLEQTFAAYNGVEVISGDNLKAMKAADVVLFGFKPYMIDLVLNHPEVMGALKKKLVISVLVGSPTTKLQKAIFAHYGSPSYHYEGEDSPFSYIKRAMPNLAAEYGESMTVIESIPAPTANPVHDELTDWVFLQLGKIQSVPSNLFDIGGVMAGAAGAFLSVAFDGMLDGAVSQGLKRVDANRILSQTLVSLAKLLENEHPAVLREKFSSPKGTTIAGLMSLEEDRARWAFTKAVVASSKRSEEIGKQG